MKEGDEMQKTLFCTPPQLSKELDTYSHLMADMQDTAVRALEGMFNVG